MRNRNGMYSSGLLSGRARPALPLGPSACARPLGTHAAGDFHKGEEDKGRNQRGFTLMLAALIASVTLALGTSIFALAQKELTLSSVGRDSQFAFYAADTGAECALYWDMRFQLFPTTTATTKNLTCDNEAKTTTVLNVDGDIVSSFEFEPNGYCAKVSVTKSNTNPRTKIHVDGYNTSCANVESSSRALERSVDLTY